MKKVILIPTENQKCNQNPIRLRCRKQSGGWRSLSKSEEQRYLARAKKIVYLGFCRQDGDMFSLHTCDNYIMIFKGELNSGCY